MLTEVTSATANEGEPRRRWFSDAALDLYVWYGDGDEIEQFQLCYDKGPNERALTWNRDGGFAHHAVDDGEGGVFRMRSSPILTDATTADPESVRALFRELGAKLEHDLYEFIMTQLERSGT